MNYLLWVAREGAKNIKMELNVVREISQGPFGDVVITVTAIKVGNYGAPTMCSVLISTWFSCSHLILKTSRQERYQFPILPLSQVRSRQVKSFSIEPRIPIQAWLTAFQALSSPLSPPCLLSYCQARIMNVEWGART